MNHTGVNNHGYAQDSPRKQSGSRRPSIVWYTEEAGKPEKMPEEDQVSEKVEFSSAIGIILSCLGCVVGTGNIWRFPRVCALSSSSGGSLVFLMVWITFLNLWSTPITVVEYTLGRFARCSPFIAFYKFLGVKFLWTGSWIVLTTVIIKQVQL
ncbi:hypothetical protein Ciccas_006507 [Cichlidogyrus casuarinus]|uniref:Uncharacterized protein n=1 Tax=Cichlidogyrus casuarinus TaxID=1844966 RepID=A0ABD2Q5K5_9PLAT